ncbi:MAG: ATP-binding protein [Deltaproteobacteria bacterium]|nr:ATP-binding protein [Deltaproteobacteria bacterium]
MRYLEPLILKDLQKKMVFIGGPRQVGKTTLAEAILQKYLSKNTGGVYFNWDDDEHRRDLLKKKWSDRDTLLVFDELHKYPRWKNWIKGLYDTQKKNHRFLVTGSARLDVYRRGGDSLMGRYHYWRLHPFTLSEIPEKIGPDEAFKRLMTVGGFPEPFFDNDEQEARRWRRERFDRVLKDDVRDLESVKNIQLLGLFVDALRSRVGSPTVLSNIAEDLQVAPQTLKGWLEVLERMCLVFVVRPHARNLPRAVLKPPKVYFYDNGDVLGNEGARFENLVATHLLKKIQFAEDSRGYRYELKYIRDKEGREVDFAVFRDEKLEELVEAKYGDGEVDRSLAYYAERLKPPKAAQIVADLKRSYSRGNLRVINPLEAFLEPLG